jgi:hypothetical protein
LEHQQKTPVEPKVHHPGICAGAIRWLGAWNLTTNPRRLPFRTQSWSLEFFIPVPKGTAYTRARGSIAICAHLQKQLHFTSHRTAPFKFQAGCKRTLYRLLPVHHVLRRTGSFSDKRRVVIPVIAKSGWKPHNPHLHLSPVLAFALFEPQSSATHSGLVQALRACKSPSRYQLLGPGLWSDIPALVS